MNPIKFDAIDADLVKKAAVTSKRWSRTITTGHRWVEKNIDNKTVQQQLH